VTTEDGDKLVERLKREYDDLLKDKTHGPLGGAFCLCKSCVFQGYKARHTKSRITKNNFFLGSLLYTIGVDKKDYVDFKRNWKIVEALFNEVTGIRFKRVSFPAKNPKYRLGAYCYRIYGNALIEHQKRRRELAQKLRDKYFGTLGLWPILKIDKIYYETALLIILKRLIKIYRLAKEKKELTLRQISRMDSRFKIVVKDGEGLLWKQKKKISLFPYLWELEKLGVISFDVEKNKIYFLKNDDFLDFLSSSGIKWGKVRG